MSEPAEPQQPGQAASSPLVTSILDGTAPSQVKAAAARGALPLSRPELLRVLVALQADSDEEVRATARSNLEDWPAEEAARLVTDPATPAEVLAFFLSWVELDDELLTSLTANPSTPVSALMDSARTYPTDLLEVLLLNHTRLIESPELLDAIVENPALTPLQRNKVDEVRHHFLQPEPRQVPAPPPAQPPAAAPPESVPEAVPPEPEAPTEGEAGEAVVAAPDAEDGNAEPEAAGGVYQRVLNLNVTQKIALASRGDREERLLLIRDSSHSVQVAVINSPKVTESEVEQIAKMRNVKDEILRKISTRRDWMKNMQIVRGLVGNPKTPLPVSLTLLKRLQTQDLKTMISDRNLPDTLRRMAKKSLDQKLTRSR